MATNSCNHTFSSLSNPWHKAGWEALSIHPPRVLVQSRRTTRLPWRGLGAPCSALAPLNLQLPVQKNDFAHSCGGQGSSLCTSGA